MRSRAPVLRNDAGHFLSLPTKLRDAYRRARDLPFLKAIEIMDQGILDLTADYLAAGGMPDTSMEVLDLLRTGSAIAEVRKRMLEHEQGARIHGARKRQKIYEPVKNSAIELFHRTLPAHPDWLTKSGRVSFARAAAALSIELMNTHEGYFTSSNSRKVKGDGRLSQENFEKTLAGWLSAAHKAKVS